MTTWDEVKHDPKYVKILDHGLVGLVDSMGDDAAIVQAARVSYGSGTKSVREDRGLIRYLMRHMHTTPFEMVVFKFHIKMPIFVMRQHVRHRMSSINEYSARYSVMTDEFYFPEPNRLQAQSTLNKQGSAGSLTGTELEIANNTIRRVSEESYKDYLSLINEDGGRDYNILDRQGLTRELARMVLPVNNYTELFWTINLKNLLHYINLREDSHAQWEIQEYARAFAKIVQEKCPATYEAFEDYWQGAITLGKPEKTLLEAVITLSNDRGSSFYNAYACLKQKHSTEAELMEFYKLSKRELREFEDTWKLV